MHNGRLPQVVLGEDAQDGGADDTIRGSKQADAPKDCIPL